ncbi:MAG: biotin-dependent carboxyltransferase family protein [Bryobacteraceae bacterium]
MIQVESPGLFTTVQDLGRYGYGPIGVSPAGAADAISLRSGNLLVGNAESAAALEMTLSGGTFVFPEGGAIALVGSDFGAMLDDSPVGIWRAAEIARGGRLRIGATRTGARCYLCVAGGIAVKPFLGSASTLVSARLGGLEGRALRRGDVLHCGAGQGLPRAIPPEILDRLKPRKILRVTATLQTSRFSTKSLRKFYESVYTVTEDSNRAGLRLHGPALAPPDSGHMTSEGVSLGAIQVPPDSQPIILFVDQQTTGGYFKIANVISADLHSVGQLRPRDEVRFDLVSPETARALIREQERLIAEIAAGNKTDSCES